VRILWVKSGGLWPLTSGGRIRSFHTIAALARLHEVTVLTSHGDDGDAGELRRGLAGCEEVVSLRHAPGKRGSAEFATGVVRSWASRLPVDLWRWRTEALRREVAERLAGGGYDLVVADFLTAVPNLPAPCPLPVLLFEHNVEYLIWRRLASTAPVWQRPLIELEWRKMRRFEGRACAAADLTVAVSEADAELLAGLAPGARVRPVPTGVDTDYFAPNGRVEADGRLVFVGSMDWYPNEDATLHLIDSILPLVRRELPGAGLTVVGRNPSPRLRAAAEAAGATVTGMVPDVRPHVGEGAVVVVPLRVGGGTRLKIFEALAMGKAVVSTAIGAEGLPLVPGEHFVEADEPAEFAAAVVALLRDEERRRALGAAGRELVVERYSWEQVGREFARLCEEAAA
jgi:glycosyltransferase involved in cell wall biosynthesis